MRAWRIYPHSAPYARAPGFDPLDGAGGRVAANRWNEPGHPVLYAAANASLAALETIAHLVQPSDFGERTLIEIDLPDDVETVSAEQLLRLREDAPGDDPELLTREYGTAWLREKRSLALLAPSFVMPYDLNVLINPLHPKAERLEVIRQERVRLDARLTGGRQP
ncbi:MAG: RES family NAD+ phosphorylase [Trueperaceae bacterium]|nr:RES family NAD+ phosphorylase [Truepera sp.]HRN17766.1 RES family NAD+ phosphorylase [Trueperaceae bacterium]